MLQKSEAPLPVRLMVRRKRNIRKRNETKHLMGKDLECWDAPSQHYSGAAPTLSAGYVGLTGQQEHEMKPRMCLRREQKHRVELNIKQIH